MPVDLMKNVPGEPAELHFHYESTKPLVLFDLDGTLCEFRLENQVYVDSQGNPRSWHFEDMYEQGYFAGLSPNTNVIDAVKMLIRNDEIEVGILTAVLTDAPYAAYEKLEWLRRFIPELNPHNIVLVGCGTNKGEQIINKNAPVFLIDDYSKNLFNFEAASSLETGQKIGIKIFNGINNTRGSWAKTGGKAVDGIGTVPAIDIADTIMTYIRDVITPEYFPERNGSARSKGDSERA